MGTEAERKETGGSETVSIREIEIADAEVTARLCVELGYTATAAVLEERITQLRAHGQAQPDRAVFVACIENSVVGWIDVGITRHLQADLYGEIGGLVVATGYRSAGIGRLLTARAEQWARDRGLDQMVVRSRISREAAHRFYLREGYQQTKTSMVFSKTLD